MTELVIRLQKEGYLTFAIEQADKSVMLHDFEFDFYQKTAIIFGHEVKGVSDEVIPLAIWNQTFS